MTAVQSTLIPLQSNNAEFQAWVTAFHNLLVACGLTQASDTGQCNPATITAPAGASASQGYEIWRFADSHQAAAPIFIKIEYGSGGAATRPQLFFTAGTATDGAGTITNITHTRTGGVGSQAGGGTSTPVKIYASYDGASGTFMCAWNPAIDSGTNIMGNLFAVSRFGDRSGPLATGWTTHQSYSNNGWATTWYVPTTTLVNSGQHFMWTGAGNSLSYNNGQYIPAFYCYTWALGARWLPGFMGAAINDFPPAGIVSIVGLDGVSRNYWVSPAALSQAASMGQSTSTGRMLVAFQ